MVKKLLLPQEIEVFYILPTIRKSLAKYMLKMMKQKDVACIFGITEAGISQYMSNKRANELHFDDDFEKEVEKSARRIVNKSDYIKETQKLLKLIRSTKEICKIHRMFSSVPMNCNCESMGCNKQ